MLDHYGDWESFSDSFTGFRVKAEEFYQAWNEMEHPLPRLTEIGARRGKSHFGLVDAYEGNELFGPQSGNGFQDLAQYDEDGDGWIDENDSVWDRLKIWCQDESGNVGTVQYLDMVQ